MRTAILLFFVAIMSACASVDDSKKTITLDSATRQYERSIRWGEYEAAVSLRRDSTVTHADMDHLKTVKVTAYEQVRQTDSADRSETALEVKISYYNEYTMKEITFIDYQTWKYDPDNKSWYITSPLPAFK
jgi:hypothetical protein